MPTATASLEDDGTAKGSKLGWGSIARDPPRLRSYLGKVVGQK